MKTPEQNSRNACTDRVFCCRRGWSVALLTPQSFKPTKNIYDALDKSPNPPPRRSGKHHSSLSKEEDLPPRVYVPGIRSLPTGYYDTPATLPPRNEARAWDISPSAAANSPQLPPEPQDLYDYEDEDLLYEPDLFSFQEEEEDDDDLYEEYDDDDDDYDEEEEYEDEGEEVEVVLDADEASGADFAGSYPDPPSPLSPVPIPTVPTPPPGDGPDDYQGGPEDESSGNSSSGGGDGDGSSEGGSSLYQQDLAEDDDGEEGEEGEEEGDGLDDGILWVSNMEDQVSEDDESEGDGGQEEGGDGGGGGDGDGDGDEDGDRDGIGRILPANSSQHIWEDPEPSRPLSASAPGVHGHHYLHYHHHHYHHYHHHHCHRQGEEEGEEQEEEDDEEEEEPEPAPPPLSFIFSTTERNAYLLPTSFLSPTVYCRSFLQQQFPPDQQYLQQINRLNMVLPIPELSLVVAASQPGRVGLFRLTRSGGHFGMRLDTTLPREGGNSGTDVEERPPVALLGVAVSPIQGKQMGRNGRAGSSGSSSSDRSDDVGGRRKRKELQRGGGWRGVEARRRWRLTMVYTDGSILSYELGRETEEEGPGGLNAVLGWDEFVIV